MKVQLDDVLGYAKTLKELLELLEETLTRSHNVLINLEKSILVSKKVTWCGRSLSMKESHSILL